MANDRNQELHSCQVCGKESAKLKRLKKHYGKKHPEYELMLCPCCDYVTLQTSSMKTHIKSSHPDAVFSCPNCNFSTQKWKKWSRHQTSHHLNEMTTNVVKKTARDTVTTPLKVSSQSDNTNSDNTKSGLGIQVEQLMFGSDALTSRHFNGSVVDNKHPEEVVPLNIPPTCSLCAHQSMSFKRLRRHFSKKHPTVEFLCCSICDFTGLEQSEIDMHMKSQHSKNSLFAKVFVSQESAKDFDTETNQNTSYHDVKDSKRELFSAKRRKDCDFHLDISAHTIKDELLALKSENIKSTSHQKVKDCKNVTKKYVCSQCGMTTQYASSLREHMLTHSGLQPHVCDVCDKRFTTVRCLKKHKSLHLDERPFACKYCDFTTKDECNLKQHLRSHLNIKPYKCTFCDFATSHRTSITYHLRKHKGIRPFACSYCQKTFISRWNMTVHIKKLHLDEGD